MVSIRSLANPEIISAQASGPRLAFEIWKLGIARKRCDMRYKNNKTDFTVDQVSPATFQTFDWAV